MLVKFGRAVGAKIGSKRRVIEKVNQDFIQSEFPVQLELTGNQIVPGVSASDGCPQISLASSLTYIYLIFSVVGTAHYRKTLPRE